MIARPTATRIFRTRTTVINIDDNPGLRPVGRTAPARQQRDEIDARIARLQALRAELDRMIRDCGSGKVAQCRIMEVLANHNRCLATRRGEVSSA